MAARGVAKADPASADCIVGYALGTRQVFNDYYAGWGAGWGYGYGWGRRGWGWGGGWGYDGPWVENETRIVVDVFDARAHKAIWHGAVSQNDLGPHRTDAEPRSMPRPPRYSRSSPIGSRACGIRRRRGPS